MGWRWIGARRSRNYCYARRAHADPLGSRWFLTGLFEGPFEAFNEPYPLSTGRVNARPAGEGTDGASTQGNQVAAKTERK